MIYYVLLDQILEIGKVNLLMKTNFSSQKNVLLTYNFDAELELEGNACLT